MMIRAFPFLLLAACAAPDAAPQPAQLPVIRDCAPGFTRNETKVWTGAPTAVIDGDSFCMGDVEVRLRRFNAPEWDEPGGPEATERLRALLSASPSVTCEGFARHGDRVIAECTLADGRSLDRTLKAGDRP